MTRFDSLRAPDRWSPIFSREFEHGAHWGHVTERLLATIIFKLNDAFIDEIEVRHSPRLSLSRKRVKGKNQLVLAITLDHRTQHVPLTLGAKHIILGEYEVDLASAAGPMKLVNVLVSTVEKFWTYPNGP